MKFRRKRDSASVSIGKSDISQISSNGIITMKFGDNDTYSIHIDLNNVTNELVYHAIKEICKQFGFSLFPVKFE